ncbi:MAG: hypothetical protein EP330_16405 [Deltaproteobacteria bacterium]|nr:MAG: hypothetical protein EP330_16405 [Deltaproteobacteria bacterium]
MFLSLALSLVACAAGDDEPVVDDIIESDTDTDADADSDTDTDTDTDADADACAPLPSPTGTVVQVSPGDDLEAVLEALQTGETAMLAAGTYTLDAGAYIQLQTDGVTVRGATGDARDVVIDGNWQTQFGLSIQASDVVVSDLTLQRFYYHPVHVTPAAGRDIEGVELYRIRVIDGAEQAIKINTAENGTRFADRGLVACSHLELTDAGRPQVRNNCYTGGIDMHQGWGWTFRDNTVVGFWCESGLSEHGIHVWRGCRDTHIARNVLRDNARGIGLGLGSDTTGRRYEDDPCGGTLAQDYDGTVINNVVVATDTDLQSSASGFDVGIALESACGATVLHNTVYSDYAPYSSIEYRFDPTDGVVANNLVSHNVRDRGVGGDVTEAGNAVGAQSTWFADIAGGDAHLVDGNGAEDAGDSAWTLPTDIDGDPRGNPPDAGADER